MTNFKLAPHDISKVPSGEEIASKLQSLIGSHFPLTDKPKTNGANLRKLITTVLDNGNIQVSDKNDFLIVPTKGKGVPRLLACLCDAYIVTTGDTYNLQVWNRFPNSSDILIRYKRDKATIKCNDIRFILVRVDAVKQNIDSIIVATPQYIEEKFGLFGRPTLKYQMIISGSMRERIITHQDKYLLKDDTKKIAKHSVSELDLDGLSICQSPESGKILSLSEIKDKIVNSLIGLKIEGTDTKARGQFLEKRIANLLGYASDNSLVGRYPDIPNQLLEVKVQDSPTVDLGKYSPSQPVLIEKSLGVTTEDIRYIIALTNTCSVIEGVILAPGKALCEMFTVVSDTSYKCQRSIPMSFFISHNGKAVFNP